MAYSLDDGWDNCGPVARAGNACFGLYVRCGIWVARNLTDGFVPGEIASAYGSPEQARKLVDVGLWEAVDGGYLAVDYLTLNPTADKVRERRKADAERKARWRDKAHAQRKTRDATRESNGSHAVTDAVTPRSPTPLKGGKGRAPAQAQGAARVPERTSPLVDPPAQVAKPPDLSAVRAKLRADSAKHHAAGNRRDGRAFDELRELTDVPDHADPAETA